MRTIHTCLALALLALVCSGCVPLIIGLGLGAGAAVGGYEMHHHVLHDQTKAPAKPSQAVQPQPMASDYPNPKFTHPVYDPTCGLKDICPHLSAAWQHKRNVSKITKKLICHEYGYTKDCPDKTVDGKKVQNVEIDHDGPRELCGSNDPNNLGAESYEGPMSAHQKDAVENFLHQRVCRIGTEAALKQAQHDIEHWQDVYRTIPKAAMHQALLHR